MRYLALALVILMVIPTTAFAGDGRLLGKILEGVDVDLDIDGDLAEDLLGNLFGNSRRGSSNDRNVFEDILEDGVDEFVDMGTRMIRNRQEHKFDTQEMTLKTGLKMKLNGQKHQHDLEKMQLKSGLSIREGTHEVDQDGVRYWNEHRIESGNAPVSINPEYRNLGTVGAVSSTAPSYSQTNSRVIPPAPRQAPLNQVPDAKFSTKQSPSYQYATVARSTSSPQTNGKFEEGGKMYWQRGHDLFVLVSSGNSNESWLKVE